MSQSRKALRGRWSRMEAVCGCTTISWEDYYGWNHERAIPCLKTAYHWVGNSYVNEQQWWGFSVLTENTKRLSHGKHGNAGLESWRFLLCLIMLSVFICWSCFLLLLHTDTELFYTVLRRLLSYLTATFLPIRLNHFSYNLILRCHCFLSEYASELMNSTICWIQSRLIL